MKETVSVDEAIKKGILTVNLPALLIFLIGLIASLSMSFVFFRPYEMVIGLLLSYALAATYRGLMAAKWRIWAFEKVRNVHELHERALLEKLLFLNNRIGFGIINFNTENQKAQWEHLQLKFQQPDIFIDDTSIPAETTIRYSILRYVIWTILSLLMAAFGIYLCALDRAIGYIIGIPLVLIGAVNSFFKIKKMFNRTPQIMISDDGLRAGNTPFYKWNQIANEKTIREGEGKYAMYYLCYDHPHGSTKFHLDDLEFHATGLQKILRVYRERAGGKG